MSDLEVAWAAGLFEGEGTFFANERKQVGREVGSVGMRAQLAMTDLDVLQHFHRVVGVGSIVGPHSQKRSPWAVGEWKPRWSWSAERCEDVLVVVEMFRPWLGRRRLEQAKIMIERRRAYEATATHHNVRKVFADV